MQTLTAMFDSRADAEQARTRLAAAGISQDEVTIHDQATTGIGGTASEHHGGLWDSIKSLFRDDSHVYEEGLRRGGYLLTARVDDHMVDRAYDILDDEGTVDLGERSSNWQRDGWTGGALAAGSGNWRDADRDTGAIPREYGAEDRTLTGTHGRDYDADGDRDLGDKVKEGWDKLTGQHDHATGTASALGATGRTDEVIPVVEEQLQVGKREVRRGGVRVRSYVVETPVHEEVRLREEHVDVERRPVTGAQAVRPGEAGDLFQDRTIEAVETAEEAVVAKEAVVREEVAIHRSVDERVERIDDTVRRTEVDVDRFDGTDPLDRR